MRTLSFVFLSLSLAACAPEKGVGGPSAGADSAACPVIESGDWHAWVDPPRDGGEGMLRVRGRLDLPTPGYTVAWALGPTDRAMPPGQRIRVMLTPPDGIVAQVVTPTAIEIDAPTRLREYRTVIIGCGDTVLHDFGKVTPLE